MSFSATILFSPPGGSEARCCCCACKSETGASSTGSQGGNPPASTPITVTGHGLAVQSPEQLLHIIYQRVEKAVGLAEAALGLARANNELLKRLQEEVGELKQGKASAPDEDEVSRAHGSPPEEPGPLKESPGEACKASAAAGAEEDCDSVGSGMQVVIEELWQVGATAAGAPGPLGFPAAQRDMRLPGCALAASEAAPMLNPKLVHNVHNHITNDKRFNGSESIKSSWNISVVKFLLEKLKQELVTSPHNYTDKELKGACVAYFLTKRREYRNSLNPFKGLKEKEEKKLRSRRYRLFANRSSIMRHFGPEDQRLWKDVTEELMSDEEDSLNEPGVWVARPPRFRAQRLTELCYHLDANSKHGTKANRVYGPPSDRLPSAEAQLLPPELYNPNFQEEEDEGGDENGPVSPSFDQPHKTCCPDLNSFIEIKVEKDE
ncbi:uncharacterized protein C14orf93 homolog isoform X3 [Canis lupus baileyi]|uniref:uncharacterized protein C14orf93 homolog isoform X3 n=1 Tax=Canis lupus familiaris TaxID=9615 RepID=UPI0003AD93DB|nr:uncharacterized protein C14orf93 homolog isoform X3 [Canis lupus familiaris]XP_038400115.1 uncharacterized protein C14orf93 homolog isoform X3 [Canis lupus familiaris]XP_038529039.1 uncharacterized protein C14orf93 homolog isoform X3 [Canis lupus familiaris]|eukprot:XP_022277513.1 uncharacterized protein C14orf93 homolog isoform X3 [Canis lupus familiaris]